MPTHMPKPASRSILGLALLATLIVVAQARPGRTLANFDADEADAIAAALSAPEMLELAPTPDMAPDVTPDMTPSVIADSVLPEEPAVERMDSQLPAASPPPTGPRQISMGEVKQNSGPDSIWIVYEGRVYDLSGFQHPGGMSAMYRIAGTDATDKFNAQHGPGSSQYNLLQGFYIGDLAA